jgi:hypothetical protein
LARSTPKVDYEDHTYNHNRAQNADNAFRADLRAKEAYFESLGVAHFAFLSSAAARFVERCGIETINGAAYNDVRRKKQISQI